MAEDWRCVPPEEVLRELSSTPEGLSDAEAKRRLADHGRNELERGKGVSPWAIFARQFTNLMVIVLIAAAAVSGAIGLAKGTGDELLDAVVILLIVVLNALLGFYQEHRAERTVQALRGLAPYMATVLREGRTFHVPAPELVPGDVFLIAAGDRVPADGRLLEAFNLRINESSLTGESAPVEKSIECVDVSSDETTGMVYAGCPVEYGRGKAVATATGMSTEIGRIADMLGEEREPTPLQRKLAILGRQLGVLILGACVFIFVVGLLRAIAAEEMFLTAVSLAVAAIPEGLPAIVTISLALGLQRMARRRAIVRRLPSVESLGSATVICTDKTGTLTKGEMNIREIDAGARIWVTGEGFEPLGKFIDGTGQMIDPLSSQPLVWLLRAGILCNDAELRREDDRWTIRGDTTEGTLLVLARKAGIDEEEVRRDWARISEQPFDSRTKRMITVNANEGRRYAFAKGATESILPLCSRLTEGERNIPLTPENAKEELRSSDEMASRALRVLAIAFKELPWEGNEDELAGGFTFLGQVGMMDAPRADAIEAIAKCRRAGIRVIMITGDHALTASAIAAEMGIAPAGSGVMVGHQIQELSDSQLRERIRSTSVFARVSPEHKKRIVDALHANGEIVAMTGDGVNDAPALKAADIGVAMGVTGTDVAKEASEMILLDDDFATIVNAIEEGRGIYDNIRRFVSFLLACNAGEVIAMFVAMLAFTDPLAIPLFLPIQILWINLVTDGLPAIALGLEKASPDIMGRPPDDPSEPPVTRRRGLTLALTGTVMAASTLAIFALTIAFETRGGVDTTHAYALARAAAFCGIVTSQLLYAISIRSDRSGSFFKGLAGDRYLILALVGSALLMLMVVYVPGVNQTFGMADLGWQEWVIVLPLSLMVAVVNEVRKFLTREGVKG
ncbi:MAG: cation-translocating P-type ATPase [Methanomassiliicoccales archaeon]|nr:cation-translocating P-type ATPase [Methanomassiliicoccales archaeon]